DNEMDPSNFNVRTPVKIERLKYLTRHHPNQLFIDYILEGFQNGFQYEFQGEYQSVIQPNLPSINLDTKVFAASVEDEQFKGRYIGTFALLQPLIILVRVNPCGLVSKRDTDSVVYRVINHQSA